MYRKFAVKRPVKLSELLLLRFYLFAAPVRGGTMGFVPKPKINCQFFGSVCGQKKVLGTGKAWLAPVTDCRGLQEKKLNLEKLEEWSVDSKSEQLRTTIGAGTHKQKSIFGTEDSHAEEKCLEWGGRDWDCCGPWDGISCADDYTKVRSDDRCCGESCYRYECLRLGSPLYFLFSYVCVCGCVWSCLRVECAPIPILHNSHVWPPEPFGAPLK